MTWKPGDPSPPQAFDPWRGTEWMQARGFTVRLYEGGGWMRSIDGHLRLCFHLRCTAMYFWHECQLAVDHELPHVSGLWQWNE